MGDVTIKEVAGGVGGVASTVLIPQYLKLWRGGSWWWIAGMAVTALKNSYINATDCPFIRKFK